MSCYKAIGQKEQEDLKGQVTLAPSPVGGEQKGRLKLLTRVDVESCALILSEPS